MIYVIFSIDTECDKDRNWRIPRPMTFRNVLRELPEVLHPMFNQLDLIPTYLLSPEVIKEKACVDVLQNLPGQFELGTHLHAEFIEPAEDRHAEGAFLFQGDLGEHLESAKLQSLTDLFSAAFGYRPTSFRAGRFGLGPHTLRLLNRLGYLVDSSIMPLSIISAQTIRHNFYDIEPRPFFSESFGSLPRLLEVPVTVYSDFFMSLPKRLRKPLSSTPFLHMIAGKLLGRERVKTFSLRPSTYSFDSMKRVVDRQLAYCKNEPIVILNMMFHSSEMTPGASPASKSDRDVDLLKDRLIAACKYMKELGAKGLTLSGAWFVRKGLPVPDWPGKYFDAAA